MKAIRAFLARPERRLRWVLIVLGVGLIYLLPVLSIPGLAAIYLKFEGIDGEAQSKGHEGWIEVESLQWGVGRAISFPAGGQRDVSAPTVSEVSLGKVMDKSSPLLFLEAAAGKVFPKVEIHVTRSSQDGEETFYTMTLSDVLVSAYSASSGGDRPSESISLNFPKVEMEYKSPRPDGSTESVKAGYDFQLNQKQ